MYKVYLPHINKFATRYPQTLGIGLPIVSAESAKKVAGLGIRNVKVGNARWSSYWNDPDAELRRIADLLVPAIENGLAPSLTFFGSPAVASVSGKVDDAIRIEYYQEFVRWMTMIVRTFKLRDIQLWNEPDSPFIAEGHFGGWEDAAEFARFANYVRQSFDRCGLNDTSISIGLMLPNNSFQWFADAMRGGLGTAIDNINLHHYATFWPGATFEDLKDAGFPGGIKSRIGATNSFLELYGVTEIGINVGEINLRLRDGDSSTGYYEGVKSKWLEYTIPAAFSAGARLVSVYAYKSGWAGCDIEDLPAELVVKSLASKYNYEGGLSNAKA